MTITAVISNAATGDRLYELESEDAIAVLGWLSYNIPQLAGVNKFPTNVEDYLIEVKGLPAEGLENIEPDSNPPTEVIQGAIDPGELTADEAIELIESLDPTNPQDLQVIRNILSLEQQGKNRKTVIQAANEAIG